MSRRKVRPSRVEQSSLGFLDSTAEAAFASDEKHRIVVWNRAAENLLGHGASEVVGRRCHEVIQGNDVFGNRFCSESCPLRKMDQRHEPIHAFHVEALTASGGRVKAECNIVIVPGPRPGGHSLIHLLRPLAEDLESQKIKRPRPDSAPAPALETERGKEPSSCCPRTLSNREVQVLRLVASGTDTEKIASLLCISPVTVRNHIQHILDKLEVHNKLHAIFVARRLNLL